MKSLAAILASPLLCLGVLGGIAADNARHVRPQDAAPFHKRAKVAVEAFPYVIGYWTGQDEKVPKSAVQLLRPNAIVSRRYVNQEANAANVEASFLLVQCGDSRDMSGHYPPKCYPSAGEPMLDSRRFTLQCGDMEIKGTEYTFDCRRRQGGLSRRSVYDFFVVPGKGVVADIEDVWAAARDYQRRGFGAAQFQVVMNADLPTDQRDAIFKTLIGADTDLIRLLEPKAEPAVVR